MPCNCDYLEASGQELESSHICKMIIHLFKKIKKPIPGWVTKAASDYYGNVARMDEATKILCETIRSLTTKEINEYIYNEKFIKYLDIKKYIDSIECDLASWWKKHQEWDKRRVAEENATRRKVILQGRALKKLSVEEIEALGLAKRQKPDMDDEHD